MATVKDIKKSLLKMADECKGYTIEEVLDRHSELSKVYHGTRDTLITAIGDKDPLVHEVVRRRLAGDPEPWLTADECINYLHNQEFDVEGYMHMGETDGQLTSIRVLMYELGMDKEADELGAWLYD